MRLLLDSSKIGQEISTSLDLSVQVQPWRCVMISGEPIDRRPRSAIVVGAGIVGLSTAWFLQERGVDVTVVDRTGVAAGASWGNAGWIAPSLTIPLNQPSVLRYGIRSLTNPTAPLNIPWKIDVGLGMFLARFALNCRRSSAMRAVQAQLPLNEECIDAFDVLTGNGVEAPITTSSITAIFQDAQQADHLLGEMRQLEDAGQATFITRISGRALHEQVPLASMAVTVGVNIHGQRYVDPGQFVEALGHSVVERGATMRALEITDVLPSGNGVAVYPRSGRPFTADAAVIATGAWLSRLVGRWVRIPVQAGRGYSFTVPVDRPMPCPIYLPDVRVACTPYKGAMRVSGTMEFRHPDDPVVPTRVEAIVASASPLLQGVRWDERSDVWVGPRPVTTDGRPLIGEVARGVYVAGGHAMRGLVHGPVTGRLLAEHIATGKRPEALRDFDPLR
jgi:D-amino-acid dehydrogenase